MDWLLTHPTLIKPLNPLSSVSQHQSSNVNLIAHLCKVHKAIGDDTIRVVL